MANLAAFRTRIQNSLDDITDKYSDAVIDEALRKVLNEYTRANPNFKTHEHTVSAAGRVQTLSASALIAITKLVHPYNDALADPFAYQREDFILQFVDGVPVVFFTGTDIPQVDEVVYIEYAGKQTITDLDSATATTVRDDHEDILVVGASGQAAMMRASGLNEQWGGRAGEMSSLMTWGNAQYSRFLEFLAEIKQEVNIDIFPNAFWSLDDWDA